MYEGLNIGPSCSKPDTKDRRAERKDGRVRKAECSANRYNDDSDSNVSSEKNEAWTAN